MQEAGYFERRVGTCLRGKWQLDRLLGVGGMAAVYEAHHAKLGRREAVKILHPEISHSADTRQRFEHEALAVNQLGHPGAVEVRDIDISEDGAPFLVMELLEGHDLATALRQRGPLPADEVLRLADQALDVLAAAHAVGIIHRDIKPDNLFLLRDGRLKVLDFGVARLRQRDTPNAPTRTGALIGTVAYMAPEQVSGRSDLDGRADIFAVGATMFRLLTGRHLHPNDNDLQLILQMASDQAPSLRSIVPTLPVHVGTIVDRALAFQRSHRYPDARAMQDDIRRVLHGEAPAPFIPSAEPSLPKPGSTPTVVPGQASPLSAPAFPLGGLPVAAAQYSGVSIVSSPATPTHASAVASYAPPHAGVAPPGYTPTTPPGYTPTTTPSSLAAMPPHGATPTLGVVAAPPGYHSVVSGHDPTSLPTPSQVRPPTSAAGPVLTVQGAPLGVAATSVNLSPDSRRPVVAGPPALEALGRRSVMIPVPAAIALVCVTGLVVLSLSGYLLWRVLSPTPAESLTSPPSTATTPASTAPTATAPATTTAASPPTTTAPVAATTNVGTLPTAPATTPVATSFPLPLNTAQPFPTTSPPSGGNSKGKGKDKGKKGK